MSFQAYLDAIERISGVSIDKIHQKMVQDSLLHDNLKALELIKYLHDTYSIGKGHSMALWKYAIEHEWFKTKHTTIR
jgi:hypothetical protein